MSKRYLSELESELRVLPKRERLNALGDVKAHLTEADADYEEAVEAFGTPADYATTLMLGLPYNWRLSQVLDRCWDPTNPKVLVGKAFGWGYGINFGAVAVSLGLINPDDDGEELLAAIPDSWWRAGFWASTVVGVPAIATLLTQLPLPESLPIHWNLVGHPDSHASTPVALALSLGPLLASWAASGVVVRKRRMSGLAWAGLLGGLATFSSGILIGSVTSAFLPIIIGFVGAPLVFILCIAGPINRGRRNIVPKGRP